MVRACGDQEAALGALALCWRGGQKKIAGEWNDQGRKKKVIKGKILIINT